MKTKENSKIEHAFQEARSSF